MIKSKKQMYTVIGAFVLVMLLGTITYAFFNYTRTGVANRIQVGRIYFNAEQGNTVTLSDLFPITLEGSAEVSSETPGVGSLTFHVTGDTTYSEGIEYLVKAVDVTNSTGGVSVPISIAIKYEATEVATGETPKTIGTEDEDYYTNRGGNASVYKVLSTDSITNDGDLVVGYIAPGNAGIDGNITIMAYLDAENIAISDTYNEASPETDTNGTTTNWVDGRTIFTTSEWNQLQSSGVSFKIRVEANEGIWVEEPLTGAKMVKMAIEAKQNAETNACNPVWIDNLETSTTSDDIIYFSGKGNCLNMNFVWYSGKLWRITAIYPDGAMKMVTVNSIAALAYNEAGYPNFNDSYIYHWLNEDFYDTLYHANEFIDTSKTWNATNSNASSRDDISNRLPETTLINSKVGLLNSYEFYNTYRCYESSQCNGTTYSGSYINDYDNKWLLNPYSSSYSWYIDSSFGGDSALSSNGYGVNPAIILKPGIEFTGDGTYNSPYRIVGDKAVGVTNELINTRLSGEYVKLKNGNNEQVFRIIDIEDGKTKIISRDLANNGETYMFSTSTSDTLWGSGATTDSGTVYDYLNNTYYPNMVNIYGNLFDSGIYYMGYYHDDYRYSICNSVYNEITDNYDKTTKECVKTDRTGVFNVGLPRYGELFSPFKSFYVDLSYQATWSINSDSTNFVLGLYPMPTDKDLLSATNVVGVQPTLYLKSSVKIISGTGTEQDPYVVGL